MFYVGMIAMGFLIAVGFNLGNMFMGWMRT